MVILQVEGVKSELDTLEENGGKEGFCMEYVMNASDSMQIDVPIPFKCCTFKNDHFKYNFFGFSLLKHSSTSIFQSFNNMFNSYSKTRKTYT